MTKVINFKERKDKRSEQRRRHFERVLFNQFLGAYSLLEKGGGLYPISLVDISRSGLMFQIPAGPKNDIPFPVDSEVGLRLYFTKQTFVPISLTIKNHRHTTENGQEVIRFGGEFDRSTKSFKVLESFIEFLYSYSEFSQLDKGDLKVYFR